MSQITETLYIENATTLLERLARIDTIIEALELRMVSVGTTNSSTAQYSIDDGQTKLNTEYTTVEAMAKGIEGFDRLRERLINKLNGRNFVLRPARGLI